MRIKSPLLLAAPAAIMAMAPLAQARDAAATEAPTAEAPDPERLIAAERTVMRLLPPGTYARLMDNSMDQMMDMVMQGAGRMPLRDLAKAGGLDEAQLETMGDGTLIDMMTILDPAYDERMRITTRVMTGEMKGLLDRFEPAIRAGLAQAYAKRFTIGQLDELTAFFSTGTGALYASESFAMFMDPAVMTKMQELMPEVMKEMPAIIGKVSEATKDLPPPRKYADLDDEEKARLDALLGSVPHPGEDGEHGAEESATD